MQMNRRYISFADRMERDKNNKKKRSCSRREKKNKFHQFFVNIFFVLETREDKKKLFNVNTIFKLSLVDDSPKPFITQNDHAICSNATSIIHADYQNNTEVFLLVQFFDCFTAPMNFVVICNAAVHTLTHINEKLAGFEKLSPSCMRVPVCTYTYARAQLNRIFQ